MFDMAVCGMGGGGEGVNTRWTPCLLPGQVWCTTTHSSMSCMWWIMHQCSCCCEVSPHPWVSSAHLQPLGLAGGTAEVCCPPGT